VRELVHAVRTAAQEALFEGATAVKSKHLPREAGLAFMPSLAAEAPAVASPKPPAPPAKPPRAPTDPPKSAPTPPSRRRAVTGSKPTDEEIAAALQKTSFNVSAVAVDLGMHRTQLRRRLEEDPLKTLIERAKRLRADDDTSEPPGVDTQE
jgi:DNA-binding NtrC family response regulator